jgi:hypothetical protein
VILFHSIIQVAVRSVDHFSAQYPAYGTRIRVVPIGGHPHRLVADYFLGLSKEFLGGGYVSLFRKHRVYQIAISINGSVEVVPLATDFDVCFVDVR